MTQKTTSQKLLETLFTNIFDELTVDSILPLEELTPELLAEEVLRMGFVYSLQGNMTADILRVVAAEMRERINAGEVAEVAAFPTGTTGLREAIQERDKIHEEPDTWLEDFAEKIEQGDFQYKDSDE